MIFSTPFFAGRKASEHYALHYFSILVIINFCIYCLIFFCISRFSTSVLQIFLRSPEDEGSDRQAVKNMYRLTGWEICSASASITVGKGKVIRVPAMKVYMGIDV
jgi:uncharacterized membrane protein